MDKTYSCETPVTQFLGVYHFIKLHKRTQKTNLTLHFSHQTELSKIGQNRNGPVQFIAGVLYIVSSKLSSFFLVT
jgi:hypothetical protein